MRLILISVLANKKIIIPKEWSDDEALAKIAIGKSVDEMAHEMGVTKHKAYQLLTRDEEMRGRYNDAQAAKGAAIIDDILNIADNPWIPAEDKRIMVDARKWMGGKFLYNMNEKGYGPGGNPVQVNIGDAEKKVQIVVGTPKKKRADEECEDTIEEGGS